MLFIRKYVIKFPSKICQEKNLLRFLEEFSVSMSKQSITMRKMLGSFSYI
jgi:hypothetical protein